MWDTLRKYISDDTVTPLWGWADQSVNKTDGEAEYTDENLFQPIAFEYIHINVIATCFDWYTRPSSGGTHIDHV
jgi:hypothetical protein